MIIEQISPSRIIELNNKQIKCYDDIGENIDMATVSSFGEEWKAFHRFKEEEIKRVADFYFDLLTAEMVGKEKNAADFGCGTGRFTKYIHQQFGAIAAVDPSEAIFSATELLKDVNNVQFYKASIDNLPFADDYFDFVFSLGVLHHIPDTQKAMTDCVKKIKPGGYFLVYLYYNLDNRGWLFRFVFYLSNLLRLGVSKLPAKLKCFVCEVLAVIVYMLLVGLCRLLRLLGVPEKFRSKIPLQIYEAASFYVIRNDSLDRFGTPLEQRFSRKQINAMMITAGLTNIIFSEQIPYWHAVGQKV